MAARLAELTFSKRRIAGEVKKVLQSAVANAENNHGLDVDSLVVAEAWVDGEAWRRDPDRGLFVILERRCIGLLPATEPHRLRKGEAAKFRIATIHRDGKVELSLRQRAHEELDGDATAILGHLQTPGSAAIGDKSEPGSGYSMKKPNGIASQGTKHSAMPTLSTR